MDTMRLVTVSIAQLMMLAIFLGCSKGQTVIFNGPRDEIVAPEEIAIFNCHAQGDRIYWYVNGRNPSNAQSDYEERGFTFNYREINSQPNEHNWTITVEARPSNNKTRIGCAVNSGPGEHDSQEGTLIIAGPPLAPLVTQSVEYDSTNDSFVINFNWNESFTWAGFPVISYTFSLWNESSGELIDHNTTWVNASDTAIQEYQFTTEGRYCYMLKFSISASNSLGRGNITESSIGHPMKAGNIGDIETVVTFHLNGTPHFWMSFLAPEICPGYQTLTYNITVYRSLDNSVIHEFGPTQYIQQDNERTLIVKELRTGLNVSEEYEVVVVTKSIGSLQSRRKAFDTNIMCAADITPCQPCHGSGSNIDQGSPISGAVIGIIISILVIILLIVIIIILIILIARQRKHQASKCTRSGDSTDGQQLFRTNAQRKMESSNPIYEGAVYETTPGESIKPLLISSSSLSPSLDLTPHYVDLPPNLPPPRESDLPDTQPRLEAMDEIDAIKASIKMHECPNLYGTNGDEYMIMGPHKMNKDM